MGLMILFINYGTNDIVYVARQCNTGNYNPAYGDLEIRVPKGHYQELKYQKIPYKYFPESQFDPRYSKFGISAKMEGLCLIAVSRKMYFSCVETLLKAEQYRLVQYSLQNYDEVSRFWPSIKIALRTGYKIEDVGIWIDYLKLLSHFGKDTKNSHYICPPNLVDAHDKYVEKKRAFDLQMEALKKRKKQLRDEEIFKKLKSVFFGLRFSKGDIEVRVLESVKEHLEEGDRMKHCVFTNEYYLKEHSLIFSALVNGKPTETVEVDLRDLKVVQSRGLQNKNTEYHDEIVKLVNSKMDLIKERIQLKKPIRKKKLQTVAA